MYIKTLIIRGFRCFNNEFNINLNSGLNVLVGENGAGKTGVISALRQLFLDSESGRYSVTDEDFHKGFTKSATPAKNFSIRAIFDDLKKEEKIAFLPWSDSTGEASLNLHVDNKEVRGHFKRLLWGGNSKLSAFESETLDLIHCIYLPPLRDAEEKLSNGRQSRLSKLLKALSKKELQESRKEGKLHPLEQKVLDFNKSLASDSAIKINHANELIKKNLANAVGHHFGQNTLIQFSENNFSKIVEGLRLLFFPNLTNNDDALFRDLQENSLGYNNLLYIASILAELIIEDEEVKGEGDSYLKLLLIEEPEAHLHPQLQIRLLSFLENVASKNNVQVIVTTHSTVLASSVSINSIIHLANQYFPIATSLASCGIPEPSIKFINRWLDITKSTLLFARGLILVEGIAEAILLPELAKKVLSNQAEGKKSLEDLGISVINLNGIYFEHFMRLFCNFPIKNGKKFVEQEGNNLPVRCAGVTDRDPKEKEEVIGVDGKKETVLIKPPYKGNIHEGKNPALALIKDINTSDYARLFANELKTFEYDLAMEGNNIQYMAQVLVDNWLTDGSVKEKLETIKDIDWTAKSEPEKADAAFEILNRIDDSKNMGKGLFAQLLAEELENNNVQLDVPKYIVDAIHWACAIEASEIIDD